jgi:hypothetical protein
LDIEARKVGTGISNPLSGFLHLVYFFRQFRCPQHMTTKIYAEKVSIAARNLDF